MNLDSEKLRLSQLRSTRKRALNKLIPPDPFLLPMDRSGSGIFWIGFEPNLALLISKCPMQGSCHSDHLLALKSKKSQKPKQKIGNSDPPLGIEMETF